MEGGELAAEERIEIEQWLVQYPDTDIAARLAERYPHLVAAENKPTERAQ